VRAHFRFPRRAQRAILDQVEHAGLRLSLEAAFEIAAQGREAQCGQLRQCFAQRRIQVLGEIGPARQRVSHHLLRLNLSIADQFGPRHAFQVGIVGFAERQLRVEEVTQLRQQLEFVGERQLDVDAFDGVGVIAHPLQRNHHVFVDLEGVGVFRDGGRARAIQPELLARIRIDGDESFAGAAVGNTHDFGRRTRDCIFVVADDVAEQDHLRQSAAFGLGRVAHGPQITFVQMFQAGKLHAGGARLLVEIGLDFDDGWNRVPRVAEEFQAHGARELRHAMQNPARGRDEAVATFLLHARQTAEEFIGDVLAEPGFTELATFDVHLRRA
jgi:hypothetical protein